MYGQGSILGASTTVAGGATLAALPNTGGSRSVISYVALAGVVVGVAILLSTAARFVAKRHYKA